MKMRTHPAADPHLPITRKCGDFRRQTAIANRAHLSGYIWAPLVSANSKQMDLLKAQIDLHTLLELLQSSMQQKRLGHH